MTRAQTKPRLPFSGAMLVDSITAAATLDDDLRPDSERSPEELARGLAWRRFRDRTVLS